MVTSHEKVIFVHASPPTGHSPALLKFHMGEGGVDAATSHQEAMETLSQVCKLHWPAWPGLTALLHPLHWGLTRMWLMSTIYVGSASLFLVSQGLYQAGVSYHLAVNGKSFSALCDFFPEYLPKVMALQFCWTIILVFHACMCMSMELCWYRLLLFTLKGWEMQKLYDQKIVWSKELFFFFLVLNGLAVNCYFPHSTIGFDAGHSLCTYGPWPEDTTGNSPSETQVRIISFRKPCDREWPIPHPKDCPKTSNPPNYRSQKISYFLNSNFQNISCTLYTQSQCFMQTNKMKQF